MRIIKAQKVATTSMVEVTAKELKRLKEKYNWISLGKYDIENSLNEEGPIGYLAGDINYLFHENVTEPKDVWFINKDFFKENYVIIGEDE